MSDLLTRLARLRGTPVFLVTLALVLLLLFIPDLAGGLLLLVLAAGLAVLLARTWSVQPPNIRVLRLLVLALLVVIAVTKLR